MFKGPPWQAAPWFKALLDPLPVIQAAAPPHQDFTYAPEITFGPLVPGAPWLFRKPPDATSITQVMPPQRGPDQAIMPEVREGPPMRGAPWVLPHWIEQPDRVEPPTIPPPRATQGGPVMPEVKWGPAFPGAPWVIPVPTQFGISPKIVPPPPNRPPKGILTLPTRHPEMPQRLRRFTEILAQQVNSLLRHNRLVALKVVPPGGTTPQVHEGEWEIQGAGSFQSARDPGPNDDATNFIPVGSLWVNTVTGVVWICRSNAVGAANWGALVAGTGISGSFP